MGAETAAVLANKTQLDSSHATDDNVIDASEDREDDGEEEEDTNRPLTTGKTVSFEGQCLFLSRFPLNENSKEQLKRFQIFWNWPLDNAKALCRFSDDEIIVR